MALCIQTACRGGGRGRWVCRDADKTSLKRDDQHRKKPSSSLPSQFPAKLVYFWPGQNICGATATFTPFFAPPGYFYCLTLQHLPARMRWENTHAPFCLRWKRPVYNWSAILLISNVRTAGSRSGFLCLAENSSSRVRIGKNLLEHSIRLHCCLSCFIFIYLLLQGIRII
jgi:hypothetical protein